MSSTTQSNYSRRVSMQSSRKFRLAELTEQRIQQCAILFARQFKKHNPIWNELVKTEAEIYEYALLKIAECIQWQKELRDQGAIPKQAYYNMIYLDSDNKVACVNIGYDLHHYKNRSSTIRLNQFHIFNDFDQKSKAVLDPLDTVPGTAYYSHLGTVSEKYMGSQLIVAFHYELQTWLSQNGYKKMYSRLTNQKSIKLSLDYGGEVMLRASMQVGKVQYPMAFVKIEIKPHFLQAKIQDKQTEKQSTKPKL